MIQDSKILKNSKVLKAGSIFAPEVFVPNHGTPPS